LLQLLHALRSDDAHCDLDLIFRFDSKSEREFYWLLTVNTRQARMVWCDLDATRDTSQRVICSSQQSSTV
jgi:hypothetical protein